MANNDRFRANFAKKIEQAKSKHELFYTWLIEEFDSRLVYGSPVGNPENWLSLHPFMSLVTPTGKMKKNPASGDIQFGIAPPKGYAGGRFRANWNVGDGEIDASTSEETDANGGATIERNKQIIESIKINGQIVYLTNSLQYAYRLEYEGWSKQAPAGMVRVTISELSGIINEVGARVKIV